MLVLLLVYLLLLVGFDRLSFFRLLSFKSCALDLYLDLQYLILL
jgi:hypothetical protein